MIDDTTDAAAAARAVAAATGAAARVVAGADKAPGGPAAVARRSHAGRQAGLLGLGVGVVAAGAAAGVALERLTVGRTIRRRARLALDAAGPFGALRGPSGTAVAEDGTELYYEIDPVRDSAPPATSPATPSFDAVTSSSPVPPYPVQAPDSARPHAASPEEPSADSRRQRRDGWWRMAPTRGGRTRRGSRSGAGDGPGPVDRPQAGPPHVGDSDSESGPGTVPGTAAGPGTDSPTVVFCHGYCLNQDSWHFQRAALRGAVRAVYWDQRSHGRSQRGRSQADGEPATIDQLGWDLKAVLDAAVPEGPIVLVGHSMGGMTMMAFADQFPHFVRERVVGVMLVGTSAGKLGTVTLGLPAVGAKALHRVVPGLLKALGTQVDLVERGRRATADLFAAIVKRYSFGSDVDPAVARFAERMLESTPIDVVAEFYPAFTQHEKAEALVVLDGTPTTVVAGDKDLLTPAEHSAAIAEALPRAELVAVSDAGHLVMMEHPDLVNGLMAELLVRAADAAGIALPDAVRELAEQAAGDFPE